MKRKLILSSLIVLGAGFMFEGCGLFLPDVKVSVNVLDQRTQLENQVRGSYEELSEDLMLIASVRGIDEQGKLKPKPPVAPGKEEALKALQSREFNKDDIESFKKDGCAGEGNDGFLHERPCEKTAKDSHAAEFLKALIEEENADRLVLMKRVIETNSDLTEKDMDEVKKIFANLNRDSSSPGEWIQEEGGGWKKKGS